MPLFIKTSRVRAFRIWFDFLMTSLDTFLPKALLLQLPPKLPELSWLHGILGLLYGRLTGCVATSPLPLKVVAYSGTIYFNRTPQTIYGAIILQGHNSRILVCLQNCHQISSNSSDLKASDVQVRGDLDQDIFFPIRVKTIKKILSILIKIFLLIQFNEGI